jgi:hypothetical protein
MNELLTERQRAAAQLQHEQEIIKRKYYRDYMAAYRARYPQAQAARVKRQSDKKRAERARRSNRDLIGG